MIRKSERTTDDSHAVNCLTFPLRQAGCEDNVVVLEYSEKALQEAAAGYRRVEAFVVKAAELTAVDLPEDLMSVLPEDFIAAMDDDLAVPRALAVVHTTVRRGNEAIGAGNTERMADLAVQVRAMTAVLGCDPLGAVWAAAHGARQDDNRAVAALESLIAEQLQLRASARKNKDWATADAVRDRLGAAGITVTDTPDGPTWSFT